MGKERGVELHRLFRLPGFALGGRFAPILPRPLARAADDGGFGEMERQAELAVGVARVPDLLQRPDAVMHVALDADGVEEELPVLAQAVQDLVVGGLDAVIVHQQRRLRIGGAGDLQMLRHIRRRPPALRPSRPFSSCWVCRPDASLR